MAAESGGYWPLAVSAILGALAWLYQKAWERKEQRLAHYYGIIDRIPAFTVRALNPAEIDVAIAQVRRLWLVGPNDVVRAANVFFESIKLAKPDSEKEAALRAFILAMRRDSSFVAALIPRFFRNELHSDEIVLHGATPH